MSRRYCGDGDINSMIEFHNAAGTTKPPDEICGFWTADGTNGAAIPATRSCAEYALLERRSAAVLISVMTQGGDG